MTEKRFIMTKNEFLTSFEDNGIKMTHQQIVNTLNDLNEENEQLKQQLKDCQIKFRKFNNHMIGAMK